MLHYCLSIQSILPARGTSYQLIASWFMNTLSYSSLLLLLLSLPLLEDSASCTATSRSSILKISLQRSKNTEQANELQFSGPVISPLPFTPITASWETLEQFWQIRLRALSFFDTWFSWSTTELFTSPSSAHHLPLARRRAKMIRKRL